MADEDHVEAVDQTTDKSTAGKHNTGASDLERVTDFSEEKEVSGDLNNAITLIMNKRKKEAEAKAELEKKLATVKVSKEDVDLIATEMEITRARAERVLKQHDGNVEKALHFLIHE
jgi:NACalpha-BTF3-like transcription factor